MTIDFRPEKLIKQYLKSLDSSLLEFCNQASGNIDEKYIEITTRCPACTSPNFSTHIQKGPLSYAFCEECKSIFQSPALRKKIIENWYNDSRSSDLGEQIRFETYDSRKSKKFIPIYQRYKEHLCEGPLLDIGCSWGYFMELITEKSAIKVDGIELNKSTAQWVRDNKGYNVWDTDIRDMQGIDNKYKVISCWGTLTHIYDPLSFLKSCYKALKPGGTLLLSTPNYRGFEFTLGEYHDLIQMTIYTIFSLNGIKTALNRAGFNHISANSLGTKDVDVVLSVIKRKPSALNNIPAFLQDILTQDSPEAHEQRKQLGEFLSNNGLSGLMEVVACK